MTDKNAKRMLAIHIIGLIVQGLLISLAIYLGCMAAQGFIASPEQEARNRITESLRAPSSFKEIENNRIWEGNDKEGRDAFILKIEYEAMNGFGGINRECQYVAISRKYLTLYWKTTLNKMTCMEKENEKFGIKALAETNEFSDK
jgi:hypothetical protein